MLGMDRETPDYIVRKECKRNRLRVKVGKSGKVSKQNGWKERV
jgi:hypothetical protein